MYIKSAIAISPQTTIDGTFFDSNIKEFVGNKYEAQEPSYGDLIPRSLLRRMNKAVRMGVGAGLMAVKDQKPQDGIVIGTAYGGIDDSFKFLHQILEYEEGTLTPTNFVQSTPNAVAGSLAMMTKNIGYNITHVNYGLAFEAALLDAMMLFEEKKANSLLIGSLEELSGHNFNMDEQAGWFKNSQIDSKNLLSSGTKGSVRGEGSSMYVMDNNPQAALAQVLEVKQFNNISQDELQEEVENLLSTHGIDSKNLGLMLGVNGDVRSDSRYHDLAYQLFPDTTQYVFKHLVGDYPTVTGFALWLAIHLLSCTTIPQELILKGSHAPQEYVLIYNCYKEKQHSLILVKKP